jgi:hypothetical protein
MGNSRLGVDIETADGFDLVVEKIQPVGQRRTHGKQVDQAAAYAEFAWRRNLGDMCVIGQGQLAAQALFVQRVALPERESVGRHECRRRQPVECCRDWHGKHVHTALHQCVQGAQAVGYQVMMRREAVIGQGLPVGKLAHAQVGREHGDFFGDTLRGKRVGTYNHNRLARHAGKISQQPCIA